MRADAFSLARANDPDAVPKLIGILAAPSEGPLVRANAAGHLGRFPRDPRAFSALERALTDPEPLVRAVAALRITPGAAGRQTAVTALVRRLGDSSTTVRVAAAVALVSLGASLGAGQLSGQDRERFESANQIFRARAQLNSDDAEQQLGAGRFYLLAGDPVTAASAFETSLKLDPDLPARYFLAYAYAQQGKLDEARKLLRAIPQADPQYPKAQTLLQAIAGR